MKRKYKVNSPHIVFDVIEGEVILINLKNGNYYNIEKNGAVVWEIIHKGCDVEDFVRIVSDKFSLNYPQVQKDMEVFISSLAMETLIVPFEDAENDSLHDAEILRLVEERLEEYSPPVLNKYSDMRDALMLDPIHEVDERGWPVMNDELYFREQNDEEPEEKKITD